MVGVAGAAAGAVLLASLGAETNAEPAGEAVVAPAAPTVRLISQSQYLNTVSQIFGPDVALEMRLAPVNRTDGLVAVGASTARATPGALAPLDRAARAVAGQVVDKRHRATLIPCKPADASRRDDKCAQMFLGQAGRLLYRRDLRPNELAAVVDVAGRNVGTGGDFYAGLGYALSGMLMAPQFLFITETIEPDLAGGWRLDGYSKASRLSFLLWDAAPDDALLTAARKGELDTPAGLRREMDRMLASPLYKNGVRAFFNDFLVLEQLASVSKDQTIYPDFSLTAANAAREQVLQIAVDHFVNRRGDYRDLFTTRRTFLNPDLGVLYKLPVGSGREGWVPYDLPADDTRAGILTQVGFLAAYDHAGRSSPTRRGRAIREVLLCQKVPDPPPTVDFSNFENPHSPLKTARERLIRHQENPVCAGCHRLTDPIGMTLENFDGAGQFRTLENGAKIDVSGSLDGVAFQDAVGLGRAMRDNSALKSCIVNRLYAYSVGRKVTIAEQPRLSRYEAALDKQGYRLDDMFRLIVLDRSFFAAAQPQPVGAGLQKVAASGGSHAHQN